jgi:hypothetical protein
MGAQAFFALPILNSRVTDFVLCPKKFEWGIQKRPVFLTLQFFTLNYGRGGAVSLPEATQLLDLSPYAGCFVQPTCHNRNLILDCPVNPI